MTCSNCKNEDAYHMHFTPDGESCDRCGAIGSASIADVYFRRPYLDPHLVDVNDPSQKDGVWIESKEHKKRIMDKLKVRESGDRVHGSRNSFVPAQGGWRV